MKIASWNVNSLKVRFTQVVEWLQKQSVDVLCLQEIKMPTEQFPYDAFTQMGYQCLVSGQKTYNGVAIISRLPMSDTVVDISNFIDLQRRFLGVTIQGVRIYCAYVPNGESLNSEKYQYKLSWLKACIQHIKEEKNHFDRMVIVGDFNIAPHDRDVHDPEQWRDSVLCSPLERELFEQLLAVGFIDCFRWLCPQERQFTWWDYRLNAFRRDMGLRIDHILCSSVLTTALKNIEIDRTVRALERPSDHAPISACFQL